MLSVSAALAGGAGFGLAASGSGVYTENRIAVDVKSAIDGDGSTVVTADRVTVEASDESRITADAAAASIAASFGFVGVAISIGVSLAFNSIDSDVVAFIDGADVTTGQLDVPATLTDPYLPSLRITAETDDAIHAISAAASVAAGFGALGVGIAGAGAWAENTILGSTQAHATSSDLDSAGSVVITADNTSDIDATILAVAVGVGAGAGGIGAAIGLALARNMIGNASDLDTEFDHRSTNNLLTLAKGDTVRIERGVRAGDVYEYLGADVVITPDHLGTDNVAVATGERVLLADGRIYERVGADLAATDLSTIDYDNEVDKKGTDDKDDDTKNWLPVSALQQDYANPDLFRRIDLERDPMVVKAYAQDTAITADGTLTVAATSDQNLDAFVLALSLIHI